MDHTINVFSWKEDPDEDGIMSKTNLDRSGKAKLDLKGYIQAYI